MRFNNKFRYKISVDETLNTEAIKIPAMLIQPYIENSIWHGLLPMEKEVGTISVEVKKNKEELIFVIEDNGIGINASLKSKENTQQEHISKGMEITEGRIKLIQKMTNSSIHINGPFDLKNDIDSAKGTRVEIIIPLE